MPLYDTIRAELASLIAKYQDFLADRRLSVSEALAILHQSALALVRTASTVKGVSNEERKREVMRAVEEFVDKVIVPIDLKNVPDFIEGRIVDPAIRYFIIQAADALVDMLANMLKSGALE